MGVTVTLTGVCHRLLKNLGDVLGFWKFSGGAPRTHIDLNLNNRADHDDLTVRALTTVFGMEPGGIIKTERAYRVVQKLGLPIPIPIHSLELLPDDSDLHHEVVMDAFQVQDESERNTLLREAFEIFDEDGNGFIEAAELKRVLDCLGLDKGWDIGEIQKMVHVVDLNLDGKIDFVEFQSMMTMY